MNTRYQLVLLAFFVCFGGRIILIAQDNDLPEDPGFRLTLILGTNFSQLDGDGYSGYTNLGLRSGIQISNQLRPHSGISIGLLYEEKGGRNSFGFSTTEPHIGLQLLSIPIEYYLSTDYNAQLKADKIRFKLGCSISRLFNVSTNLDQFNEVKSLFRKFDVAPSVGITYLFTKKTAFNLRFEKSIMNILPKLPALSLDRLSSFLFSTQFQYTF